MPVSDASRSRSRVLRVAAVTLLVSAAVFIDAVVFPLTPLPVVYCAPLLLCAHWYRPIVVLLLGLGFAVLDYVSSLEAPAMPRLLGSATLLALAILAALLARRRLQAEHHAIDAEDRQALLVRFREMVAHDLGTPLLTLGLRIEALMRRQPEATELAALERSVAHVSRLVGDLRDSARLTDRRFQISPHPIELRAVLRSTLDELALLAGDRVIHCDAAPLLTGRFDGERIRQLITNLVTNAIKYSPADIDVTLRREGDEAVLSVGDRGTGIPPEQRGRLFLPYSRMNSNDRTGVGLGLFIAKGIVDAHVAVSASPTAPGAGRCLLSVFHWRSEKQFKQARNDHRIPPAGKLTPLSICGQISAHSRARALSVHMEREHGNAPSLDRHEARSDHEARGKLVECGQRRAWAHRYPASHGNRAAVDG